MSRDGFRPTTQRRATSIIPLLGGRDDFSGIVGSLLVFGLVALFGAWVVHQLAYLIEYGSRFDAVMATAPHRYYMAQSGVLFAVVAISLLSLVCLSLRLDALQRRRLLHVLPARLHGLIPAVRVRIPGSVIGQTALGLACWQVVVFLVQENLEAMAEGGGLPGFTVLVAPAHWTVVPLHLAIALCGSLVLWTLSALLGRSCKATAAVERLVRLFIPSGSAPPHLTALAQYGPNRRLVAGVRSLRSPPLPA